MTKRGPNVTSNASQRRGRGFVQTGGVLQARIRKATEKRGFVETRLLTHWREIVGEATAAIARPIKVGYGRQGFGATLTLLTNGANAPVLQAESARIRERVNACYGYAAISTIRITQTAETGFAEAQAAFGAPQPRLDTAPQPDVKEVAHLRRTVSVVQSDALRAALETLGQNILNHQQSKHR